MSAEMIAVVVLGVFFLLIFSGLPVAFSLISCSLIFTVIFWTPAALYVSATAILTQSTKDIYLAGPLFIIMAALLEHAGFGEDLFDIMQKAFPEIPGSLAVGTIVMCTLIAAMTGIGATGVVTIGVLALPEMMKRGYDKKIALGCIPAGASLGPLIPPSILMIIVAGMLGLSVGKLFTAGVVPGLLMSLCFIIYVIVISILRPDLAPSIPIEDRQPLKERIKSLKGAILPILLVIAVLGSIYSGIATPTEAAGVGAGGAALCALIQGRLTWSAVKKSFESTLRLTSMIVWLIIGGSMFASMVSATGISALINDSLTGIANPSYALVIMMMIPLVLGMFIDGAAVTVICLPIFAQSVKMLGIDPYLFATLFTIALIAGYLTPPFGMNLFYTKAIAPPEVNMKDIYISVLPYVVIQLLILAICFIWPVLVLWLPGKMS